MSEKWLSMSELARKSGVAESTARRYVSTFHEYFAIEELPRGRKFAPECTLVLARIQELYSTGYNTDSVRSALANQFPITQATEQENEESTLTTHETEFATKADIEGVMAALEQIREETRQREAARDEWFRQRDEKLMQALRAIQETKQLIAVAEEPKQKERKRGLWNRLFGR